MANAFQYELRLTPESVRRRLEAAADRPGRRYWWLPGTTSGRPVIGEVKDDTFWLGMRHRERASFAPWLTGTITPSPTGSSVVIELRSPLTRKVRAVIGVAVAMLGVLWIAVTPSPTLLGLGLAAAAILTVLVFPLAGTRLYAHEERLLREAFEQTFAEHITGRGMGTQESTLPSASLRRSG